MATSAKRGKSSKMKRVWGSYRRRHTRKTAWHRFQQKLAGAPMHVKKDLYAQVKAGEMTMDQAQRAAGIMPHADKKRASLAQFQARRRKKARTNPSTDTLLWLAAGGAVLAGGYWWWSKQQDDELFVFVDETTGAPVAVPVPRPAPVKVPSSAPSKVSSSSASKLTASRTPSSSKVVSTATATAPPSWLAVSPEEWAKSVRDMQALLADPKTAKQQMALVEEMEKSMKVGELVPGTAFTLAVYYTATGKRVPSGLAALASGGTAKKNPSGAFAVGGLVLAGLAVWYMSQD